LTKIPTFGYYLNENSIFLRINFLIKFLLFIIFSIIALVNDFYILNFIFILLILIILANMRYFVNNKKTLLFPLYTSIIFVIFWLTLSKIDGNNLLLIFPWGTYITENTLKMLLLGVSKWVLLYFLGLIFMIISNEDEIIKDLNRLKIPKEIIISLTIAFNTIGFALKDYEIIKIAINSRKYPNKGIINKMKKIYYIGSLLILINLKKIEILNQAYYLRNKDDKRY